jgi:hypothetical protein
MKLGIVLVAIIATLSGQGWTQPKLDIVGPSFEFGTAPQGATVVNYFWFKSVGKDTIRFQQIKTGCDCASMPLPQNFLAPGDSMFLGFFWDTQQKIGMSGRYPYIYVEGLPDPYRMALKIQVGTSPDSAVPLSVKPFKAELSRMAGVSIDSVGFTLTNRGSAKMSLKMISNVPPEFSYSIPSSIEANGSAKGFVKVAPSMVDKEFKSSITIEWSTGDGSTGRLTLPIRRKLFG